MRCEKVMFYISIVMEHHGHIGWDKEILLSILPIELLVLSNK